MNAGTPVALFVGGLDKAHHFKGVEVLIEAMKQVPDMHLIVVGEGELREAYQEKASDTVPGRAHFLRKVSLERLVQLYQGVSVTVLPSVSSGEAFGMVLIESMACGTPVIASDLPGVRTVVDDKVDGFLVPAGKPDQLAGAFLAISKSSEQAASMGAAGLEKVKKHYDWQIVGAKLDAIYGGLLRVRESAT